MKDPDLIKKQNHILRGYLYLGFVYGFASCGMFVLMVMSTNPMATIGVGIGWALWTIWFVPNSFQNNTEIIRVQLLVTENRHLYESQQEVDDD